MHTLPDTSDYAWFDCDSIGSCLLCTITESICAASMLRTVAFGTKCRLKAWLMLILSTSAMKPGFCLKGLDRNCYFPGMAENWEHVGSAIGKPRTRMCPVAKCWLDCTLSQIHLQKGAPTTSSNRALLDKCICLGEVANIKDVQDVHTHTHTHMHTHMHHTLWLLSACMTFVCNGQFVEAMTSSSLSRGSLPRTNVYCMAFWFKNSLREGRSRERRSEKHALMFDGMHFPTRHFMNKEI